MKSDKFTFSAIKKSARAREYENAIQLLEDSDLVIRINLANIPLYAISLLPGIAESGTNS